jgi:hypothetical protein
VRVEPVSHVDVEFLRDIRPILQARCVSCHQGASPPGALNLADLTLIDGLPGDYFRLAADDGAQFGYPPVIANGTWRQTNASRYVRAFQSRRSLLIWKLFGQRLDGWSNADHPTETVPGNAATLPPGADPNEADLDYTGNIMPPPPALPLTADERLAFVRWIDLGAPIDTGNVDFGWHLDDLKPTIALASPRAGRHTAVIDRLRVGLADAHSGIEPGSLSIRATVPMAGRAAGAELADLAVTGVDGVWEIALSPPLHSLPDAEITVSVRDQQGNITRVVRAFSVDASLDTLFRDGFEIGVP